MYGSDSVIQILLFSRCLFDINKILICWLVSQNFNQNIDILTCYQVLGTASWNAYPVIILVTRLLCCVVFLGVMYQGRGQVQEAMCAYINALLLESSYVPCKILIGALLSKRDANALPVARCILADALRIEPTNRMAWYYLGMIHRDNGRIADAVDCFQAASMLEESDPIENFSSIL